MAGVCGVRRPMSCSSTPSKIVERVREPLTNPRRILGSQDFLPPGFQLLGRRPADAGGGIERPAEMLARMAQPNAHPIMRANLVIERADIAELLRQRRRRLFG